MSENLSVLTKARQAYQPKLPVSLKNGALSVKINKGAATESVSDQAKIKELFPNTYGLPGRSQGWQGSPHGRGSLWWPGSGWT